LGHKGKLVCAVYKKKEEKKVISEQKKEISAINQEKKMKNVLVW